MIEGPRTITEQHHRPNTLEENLEKRGIRIERPDNGTLILSYSQRSQRSETKTYKLQCQIDTNRITGISVRDINDQIISDNVEAFRILIEIRHFIESLSTQYMLKYTQFSYRQPEERPVTVNTRSMDQSTKKYINDHVIPLLCAFNFDTRRVQCDPRDPDTCIQKTFEEMFISGHSTVLIVFNHIIQEICKASREILEIRVPIAKIKEVMDRLAQQPNGSILISGSGLERWEFTVGFQESSYTVEEIKLEPYEPERMESLIKENMPIPIPNYETYNETYNNRIRKIITMLESNNINITELNSEIDLALTELKEFLSNTNPQNLHLVIVSAQRLIFVRNLANRLYGHNQQAQYPPPVAVCPLRGAETETGENLYEKMITTLLMQRVPYIIEDAINRTIKYRVSLEENMEVIIITPIHENR